MKKFVILLAFVFSILSFGNLYANSNVGHNTMAIYCIWRMTIDPNFMPEIQGQDRHELTHPDILQCSKLSQLSLAQKAFLQGVNLPDSLLFMEPSHNWAPMEILSAMYILKDFCPPTFQKQPESVKAYICRTQRYMTWGSKLHIEMDKITHAQLPYAGKEMDKHVTIERVWDVLLLKDIITEISNAEMKKGHLINGSNLLNLADSVSPISSPIKTTPELDIRGEYVNFILEKYGKKGSIAKWDNVKGIKGYVMSELLKSSKIDLEKLLPPEYPYPRTTWKAKPEDFKKGLADEMIDLVNKINLTVGPTSKDIQEQYDIDLPKSMQKEPSFRIRETDQGQKMLERVRELRK